MEKEPIAMEESRPQVCIQKVEVQNQRLVDDRLPVGRSGHVCLSDKANLYIYGGYNPVEGPYYAQFPNTIPNTPSRQVLAELWKFNYTTKKWAEDVSSDIPRAAASSCGTIGNGKILVFGGTVFPFGHVMSNDLHLYDIKSKTWSKVSTVGVGTAVPNKAYGQSIFLHGKYLYVFGGAVSFYAEPVSELHRLDLKTKEWQSLSPRGVGPRGRYKQEVVTDSHRFYILGGGHLLGVEGLDVLCTFSFEDNAWEEVSTLPDRQHGYPMPRACFACVQWRDDVYIFGGRHYAVPHTNQVLGDIWHLSLRSMQWTKMGRDLPKPTYFQSAASPYKGLAYVYGGVINENTRTSDLYEIQIGVLSLADLCWRRLVDLHPDLSSCAKQLADLGVPQDFIERL
ncbi:kelch domain-containing protein 10 [Lingula anatina]|uniref:Kelch domain-containing protein 10 n=1 Tax=Lingula anatina TaxID=7574 RepID=A0A1S3IRG6_LINAN|nr:kelch domain-containing protein 10 [Lingula anatina]|eukprot:XP_013400805.1 kelch domain-containing protein 10 [Lingula anatina]